MTQEAAAKKDTQRLQRAIIDGLEDVKAQDIAVFNTEHLSPLFERVIVASGTSNRQTKALAASVRDAVREAGFAKPRIEGEENGEWIIVDCGAAVAHIMQPAIRTYYHLEEIWGEKPVRLKFGAAKPVIAQAEEPAKKAGKTAGKTTGKATGKTAAKPAGKTAGKSAAKPAAKKPGKIDPRTQLTSDPRSDPVNDPRKAAEPVPDMAPEKPSRAQKARAAAARADAAGAAPAKKASSRSSPAKAAPRSASRAPVKSAGAGKKPATRSSSKSPSRSK
ncbi:ribosome silencing factor [Caenimonas koreensis]|uniref:ribosome silencing factor n=1 Tax=Caenimonas koreensis TaxID=367474 RepID=UPI003784CDEA